MAREWKASAFECDVTPPIGHPLCAGWYPSASAIRDALHARGLILTGPDESPMILCALDWAELSNGDHRRWREALASAVGTAPDRVAVHCTHVHDAPWPDRDAQNLLDAYGHKDLIQSHDWAECVREQVAQAVAQAWEHSVPCTQLSTGQACVERVASNRRVMGDDGRVQAVRWTLTRDPEVRAAPEGLIDPFLKTIGFWSKERPIAHLHYYAVHPTSMDGTGEVTAEFVGLARERRIREEDGVPHIYFTGCAGDITAGKYNEGTLESRKIFAERIHAAMVVSERNAARQPLERVAWQAESVCLPPREDMEEDALLALIQNPQSQRKARSRAALMLTYLQRRDFPIPITALHLNADTVILHLPSEAFLAYQLFAQQVRREAFVAVAAYGDCGPGYITHEGASEEGGYEPVDSFVSERSERILCEAITRALATISAA